MKKLFNVLRVLIDSRDRVKTAFLLCLLAVTALMNTLGVASVMPFLTAVSSPDDIQDNKFLYGLQQYLGVAETRDFLFILGLTSFVLFVTGSALQALSQWAMNRYSHMQQFHLSRRLMVRFLSRPYEFFLGRNSTDLAKTVLEESQQVVNGFVMPCLRMVIHGLLAILLIVLLILADPFLSIVIGLCFGSIYFIIFAISRKWLGRIGEVRLRANRERFRITGEAFAGAKEIRLLGRERSYLARYEAPARRYAKQQANVAVLSDLPQYAIEAFAFGGIILLVLYQMTQSGGIQELLPVIGLYAMAAKKMIPAFQHVFASSTRIKFTLPAVYSLVDELKGDQSMVLPNDTGRRSPMRVNEGVSLENVFFSYPEGERPAISGVSLSIAARTTVGLIGSSGAGKSTLVDIVLGLLRPQSGVVKVDGVVLDEHNIRSWQASIGYVPQQIFLSDDTIAANIALGVPADQIDIKSVERAARLAKLHEFVVNELPGGYQAVIGDRGVRLSGGQRQRIGIARALYRDPEVLIFDEATSALDNATEQAVMDAVNNLASLKTIVLIAHRLSTVREAHNIFILDQGNVVDSGAWEQLNGSSDSFRKVAGLS